MGIPISKYVDVRATSVDPSEGLRSFAGLVFTTEAAAESGGQHTETKAGSLTVMTFSSVAELAKSYSKLSDFATAYFGTQDVNGSTPAYLSVASYTGNDKAKAYSEAADGFGNFGGFCFFEETTADKDVAKANSSNGMKYVYVAHVPNLDSSATSESNQCYDIAGTHVCDSAILRATAMGWIGAHDYTLASPSTTIDYREFGVEATVTDGATKDALDSARVNFVGKVQNRGIERTFYQSGENCDGQDLGTYVDSAWLQSEVERGWFDIACGSAKVPADQNGLMAVRGIVVSAAEAGLDKGVILASKTLDSSQETKIKSIVGTANADGAISEVNTTGYFVDAKFTTQNGKYAVQYTLVYAKGDHVGKVSGIHVLA